MPLFAQLVDECQRLEDDVGFIAVVVAVVADATYIPNKAAMTAGLDSPLRSLFILGSLGEIPDEIGGFLTVNRCKNHRI